MNEINAKVVDWLGIPVLTLAEINELPELTPEVKPTFYPLAVYKSFDLVVYKGYVSNCFN